MESRNERLKINKFIRAIKKGWMKTYSEQQEEKQRKREEEDKVWDIWADESVVAWQPRKMPKAIPAPKRELPTHWESYNPSDEYLFDEQEREEWEKTPEEERRLSFVP